MPKTNRRRLMLAVIVLLATLVRPSTAQYRDLSGFDMHYEVSSHDDLTVHRAGWGGSRNFDRGRWGLSAPLLFFSVSELDGVTRWSPTGLATMLLFAGTWHGAGAVGLPQEIAYWPLAANGQLEWNPSYHWRFFLGTHSDLLFAEEDEDGGMLLMGNMGVERRLGVVRLAAFVARGAYWNWDGADRDLGAGFGLRLSAGPGR